MLEIRSLWCGYGENLVLRDTSLKIEAGETVALLGPNGAGKSTLVNTISGLIRVNSGEIVFEGKNISLKTPKERVEMGILQVPEGRRLFPRLSVDDNLLLGAYSKRAWKVKKETLQDVWNLFPRLNERRKQLAGLLSGGEQQQCAIARALMGKPKLLLLDEMSLGLAPVLVKMLFELIRTLNTHGITILLVEQNVSQSLSLASRGYVLENGRVVLEGMTSSLLVDDHVKKAYLGI